MQLVVIQNKIYEVNDIKVMLDFDLAELYEVETRVLNQAIKRNYRKFSERFYVSPNERRMGGNFIITDCDDVITICDDIEKT